MASKTGWRQAVLLWHRYLRGDVESLSRLIDYNRCDVIAMRYILDEVVRRLVSDLIFGSRPRGFRDTIFGFRMGVADGGAALRFKAR